MSIAARRTLVNFEDARRRLSRSRAVESDPSGPARPHPFAETEMVLRGAGGRLIRRYRPTPSGWVEVSL